jgi:CspA family cold shock protein
MASVHSPIVPPERLIGQVKWFNSKDGYGFITAREGELTGRDIFVHYSSIQTKDDEKYKYLVQGECVEFQINKLPAGEHEYIAVSITGVRGGDLMCDLRKFQQVAPPLPFHSHPAGRRHHSTSIPIAPPLTLPPQPMTAAAAVASTPSPKYKPRIYKTPDGTGHPKKHLAVRRSNAFSPPFETVDRTPTASNPQ